MDGYISSGCMLLDALLDGGFPRGKLVQVYGRKFVGKTTLALQVAIINAEKGLKTIFIDTGQSYLPHRLSQMIKKRREEDLEQIFFIKAKSFKNQLKIIDKINFYITPKTCAVIVDNVSQHYLRERLKSKDRKDMALGRLLAYQMASLNYIAEAHNIAVMVTNNGYFKKTEKEYVPVARRIMEKYSDIILLLKHDDAKSNLRKIILKKRLLDKQYPSLVKTAFFTRISLTEEGLI
ncbi:MAG: ATPase domain-containing protein [Candidatus Hodarchaeota archaeon]